MIILASGTPPPDAEFLKNFLLAASFLLNLALGASTFATRNRTQKRDVTLVGEFVCEADFDKAVIENKEAHAFLHKRISEGDNKLRDELQASVKALGKEISDVGRELAAAARSNEHQSQALLRIEGILMEGHKPK